MAKIKNLVFDFGGVFVKINVLKAIEAFQTLGFKDVDKESDPYVQKGFFGKLEGGIISDEDFRKAVSEHCGHEVSWEDLLIVAALLEIAGPGANLVYLFAGGKLHNFFNRYPRQIDTVMAILLAGCAVYILLS